MFVIQADDKDYIKALEREIDVWGPSKISNSKIDNRVTEMNSDFVSHYSSLFGVKDSSDFSWIYKIKKDFGNFEKCLSLGSGSGIVESKFIELGIVKEFDTLDIVLQSSDVEKQNHSLNDLNFVTLPKEKYDFILCKSILHHLINLEHIIEQINNSLKKNGVFTVFEFIGESKSQWNQLRKERINEHLEIRYNEIFDKVKFVEHPKTNTSPFEGIRSSDIVEILNSKFRNNKIFEFKWGKFSFPIINHLNMISRYRKDDFDMVSDYVSEIIKYFIDLECNESYANDIGDCCMFSAYSKSESIVKWELKPFGKYEKDFHFRLNLPLKLKILNFFRKFKLKILNVFRKL